MFQCDTETYLKNHTISVKIIILECYKVVFSYDFEDIAIFARGEHWQKFINIRQSLDFFQLNFHYRAYYYVRILWCILKKRVNQESTCEIVFIIT